MDWILRILPSVIVGGILAVIIVLIIMSKLKERKKEAVAAGVRDAPEAVLTALRTS